MKQIVFARHAKSSWSHPSLSDFERPLNDRGERDAPLMAKRLLESNLIPDRLISSPAVRAKTTALVVAETFGVEQSKIHFLDELYLASVSTWIETLHMLDDESGCVFCFGHNPGITEVVNVLCNESIENVPTAGTALIHAPVSEWKALSRGNNQLLQFDYPKLHK